MIRFEHVSVKFARDGTSFAAVDDFSLHIRKGEFFGIVGVSGAGKSTLVRTVNLLQRPSSGKIYVNGEEITGCQGESLRALRLKIGMIFQHFNLIGNASVFDNVAFALKASNTAKDRIRSRVMELLEQVGLSDKVKLYPNDLSGGQKQRVAIARALANEPEILLCDEATSALDPDNTAEVVQTLKNIKRDYPLTILFITHQMEVAKSLFDRIAVMEQGRLTELNNAYELFAHPQSSAARKLINKSYQSALPQEILMHEENLYIMTYKQQNAYEPVIASVSRNYTKVSLSILAGNIEYIQDQPLGRLLISLRGKDPVEREAVLAYLSKSAFLEPVIRSELYVK